VVLNKEKKAYLLAIFLWCFLAFLTPTYSESLCPLFSGPDVSADNIELTNFLVDGYGVEKIGHTVTVSFTVKNVGQQDLNFSSKGVYAVAIDPKGAKREFGSVSSNTILKPFSSVNFKQSIDLDQIGIWEFYPSYEILVEGTFMQKPVVIAKKGPEHWHACIYYFCPNYCKDNIRYYDGYIGQEESCVYKQEACENGCDAAELACMQITAPSDSDNDGIVDDKDKCPKEKETFNGYLDDDGCPDTIEIKDKIPPSVLIQHSPVDVNAEGMVTFTVKARDISEIESISIFVNDSLEKTCDIKNLVKGIDKEGQYFSCSFEGGPYAAGSLTYYAEARDKYGNLGKTLVKTINVTLHAVVSTPPIYGCFNSISGKIMNFHFPREALKIELCEAEFLPMRPELGLSRWVCKSHASLRYAELGSHDTYSFDGLCSGDFLITPVPQEIESICTPAGTFYDVEMLHGGPRKVSVPDENRADFVFMPRDEIKPEISVSITPPSATTRDDLTVTVNASDDSGIAQIEISGEVEKIIRARGHCRTEYYEGHEIEICESYEYPLSETISNRCAANSCSFRILRDGDEYERYEIRVTAKAYDQVCNVALNDFNLVVFKPALQKRKNERNYSAYREKEIFLVSDQDWRTVLSLVPIAISRECTEIPNFSPPIIGRICDSRETTRETKVPFIIFHHESLNGPYRGGFDLDSAIVFANQYKAKNVTIFVGDENLHSLLDDELYYWLINPHNALQSTSARSADNIGWFSTSPNAKIRFFDAKHISDVYNHYFSEINSVLVCDDNYEIALQCAVFAAKANMPLYFSGHYSESDISRKVVHIAGNLSTREINHIRSLAKELGSFYNGHNGNYHESPYTFEQISGGPKNILVAPLDLEKPTSFDFNFSPRVASYLSVSAFWRNSLAAPLYAAARNGVIETLKNGSIYAEDSHCGDYYTHDIVENISDSIKEKTRYMLPFVIIASPPYVPDSYYTGCTDGWAQYRKQVDREYGALGRIYGLTVTDTSAYIARALFYHEIVGAKEKVPALVIAHSIGADESSASETIDRLKSSPNYDVNCYIGRGKTGCITSTRPAAEEYLNKNLILFQDHGSYNAWSNTLGYNEIPGIGNDYYLDLPVVFGDACLTNNFWQGKTSTLGPNWIRYGAIAYYGSASVSHSPDCLSGFSYNTTGEYFIEAISAPRRGWYKKTLGGINKDLDRCTSECCAGVCWIDLCSYRDNFVLLGDPFLAPNYTVR